MNACSTNTADGCAAVSRAAPTDTLVIGCGNLLRGDDAAGGLCVRRLWDAGLPSGVLCADGGTGGMDVAFQMRGVPHVILVDACQTGAAPGTIFEVPGSELEQLPPLAGIHLHSFRWDHALAFGHWLLKDEYPQKVTVYLIEGQHFEIGRDLSEPVSRAIDTLVERLLAGDFGRRAASTDQHEPGAHERIEVTADGYLRLPAELAARYFPQDSLAVFFRDGRLSLLPTRGAAAGGLLLKQRTPRGDRCVLVSEQLPPGYEGAWDVEWDDKAGALHVNLNAGAR